MCEVIFSGPGEVYKKIKSDFWVKGCGLRFERAKTQSLTRARGSYIRQCYGRKGVVEIKEWFEDEGHWKTLEPFIFYDQRISAAPA